MSEISTINNQQRILPIALSNLFALLDPQDVEQFYRSYRLWTLQHDITALQAQLSELQQQIEHNAQLMQSIQPSPIALSVLAQLQAHGISDIDLLDRMLARGDSWLDRTAQLLARCEELNVIRGDYTQWCENALEGAYDWINSMDQAAIQPTTTEPFDENTEAALLQKLMSEDDAEQQLPAVKAVSTYGTTEAIDLAALKLPVIIQDQEDIESLVTAITPPLDESPEQTLPDQTPADNTNEQLAEHAELIANYATIQVHLHDDDQALPPVTNTHEPGISRSEPTATNTVERSEQPPQPTIMPYEARFSGDEPIEPLQVPPKKRRNLLARLFHLFGNASR